MKEKKVRLPFAAIPFFAYLLIAILRYEGVYFTLDYELRKIILGEWSIYCNSGILAIFCIITAFLLFLLCIMKRRNFLMIGAILLHTIFSTMVAVLGYGMLNWKLDFIFSAVADVMLIAIMLLNSDKFLCVGGISKVKEVINKIWFLPGAIALSGAFIGEVFPLEITKLGGWIVRSVQVDVIFAVSLFALGFWIKNPWKKEKPVVEVSSDYIDGYCSMGKHIVLSLFTFGVWPCIWTYRTTQVLNKAPGVEYYNPVTKLLLCLFVPFYQIYWYYKHGQRIDAYARQKKLNASDMATLCLILGIFIPIVANIVMQDRINAICTAKDVAIESTIKPETPQSSADELKKFKELLDSGIITQEEFDAKKKQLLNL